MKKYALILLSILLSSPTFSQNTLKVLSWNIYMLPAITNLSKEIEKNQKKARTQEIIEIMNASDYNIIIFQEAFHIPSRKKLAKKLKNKFPYQYGPINKGFIKTNSGIFVVSTIPLTQLGKIQYKDCNSSDCLARKGAALFEGKVNNKTFQILGTHLNSTSAQEIRELQYEQIYSELLKPYEKKNVPQFICGDMNTSQNNKTAYQSMLKKLDAEDIETKSELKHTTVTDHAFIDYILIKRNGSDVKTLDKQVKKFKAKAKVVAKLKGTLSDHLAIEALFKF